MVSSKATTTTDISSANLGARGAIPPVPGIVSIFANHRPGRRVFRVEQGVIELGRIELAEGDALDPGISRKHLRATVDGTGWRVADLGSRNGTYLNGIALEREARAPSGSVVRLGSVILLLVADTIPFRRYELGIRDGKVEGPSLRAALESVALARKTGMTHSLLISGESGTGKELAAQAFHAAGPKTNAPFAAVNCATIPKELAERLLFGSRRGAFSGATDALGHVQAAHGGTLFLDEIGELPPEVQSKLLRMLETREVLRLGATSYEKVDVQVCAATWRNLRDDVAAGRFREDLYFRIGQPEVRLPPLRERLEEIPWHVQQVLDECTPRGVSLEATSTFVEACALRIWPGNVRELRAEVRRAALVAAAAGSTVLTVKDLGETAGRPITQAKGATTPAFPQDEFAEALQTEGGNVAGAARRLGVHRNKVRRWLERHKVEAEHFK